MRISARGVREANRMVAVVGGVVLGAYVAAWAALRLFGIPRGLFVLIAVGLAAAWVHTAIEESR